MIFPDPVGMWTGSVGGGGGGGLTFTQSGVVSKSGSSTIQFTVPAAGIPAGTFVSVAWFNSNSARTLNSVSDTKGNVYSLGTELSFSGNKIGLAFCASTLHPIDPGEIITLTFSGSSNFLLASVGYATGIVTVSPSDKTAVGGGGSSSPSATTIAIAQASELVIGAVYNDALRTVTEAAGYTTAGDVTLNVYRLHTAYKFVSAIAAQTYAPTLSSNATWGEVLVTYKTV